VKFNRLDNKVREKTAIRNIAEENYSLTILDTYS